MNLNTHVTLPGRAPSEEWTQRRRWVPRLRQDAECGAAESPRCARSIRTGRRHGFDATRDRHDRGTGVAGWGAALAGESMAWPSMGTAVPLAAAAASLTNFAAGYT